MFYSKKTERKTYGYILVSDTSVNRNRQTSNNVRQLSNHIVNIISLFNLKGMEMRLGVGGEVGVAADTTLEKNKPRDLINMRRCCQSKASSCAGSERERESEGVGGWQGGCLIVGREEFAKGEPSEALQLPGANNTHSELQRSVQAGKHRQLLGNFLFE